MIARNPKELGQILREARLKRGMTQNELAKISGTSRHSVLRIERGEATGLGVVLRVATALRLALDLRSTDRPTTDLGKSVDIDAIVQRAKTQPR